MVTSKNLSLPQTVCRMDWSRKIAVYIFVSFYLVAKMCVATKAAYIVYIIARYMMLRDNALLQNAIGAFFFFLHTSSKSVCVCVCVCKTGIVFFLFRFIFLFTPKFCSNIYFSHPDAFSINSSDQTETTLPHYIPFHIQHFNLDDFCHLTTWHHITRTWSSI